MFCFHHFTHDAFFLLLGLLGPPFWRVLLRTLLYIPMSFLLLNDTNDLLFRTANELQDFRNMHCGAFHVIGKFHNFFWLCRLWSVLWHYTGWIDVLVCVCQCFKNLDSFLSIFRFSGWPWVSPLFRTFHRGSCSISMRHRTLFRHCRHSLACDLGSRHLVDAWMARAGEGKDLKSD